MQAQSTQSLNVQTPEDVVAVRQAVRKASLQLGFSIVDQTKAVTAASELARNMLIYGGGGVTVIDVVQNGSKAGLRIVFEDQGPGIADIELALKDGYTSGSGMGLGLGGAKRLSHEFEIESTPGRGTRVAIVRWKA
jgi:serine/threonine-protein kinase RsbT